MTDSAQTEFVLPRRTVFSSTDILTSQAITNTWRVIGVTRNESTGLKIVLLTNDATKKFIRMEFQNSVLSSTMAGNYFLVTIDGNNSSDEIETERIMKAAELADGELICLERCPTMKSLVAVHFYPPENMDLFDRLLKSTSKLGMKPFPDYVNMG